MVTFVLEHSRLFVGSCDVGEVWWWAVGGWWWWLLLVAIHGGVVWQWVGVVGCHKRRRQTMTDVVVRHLVAMLHLVGVKKEAGRSLWNPYGLVHGIHGGYA